MTSKPPPRDPRSIVTPDAFEVSEVLLGLPLAAPSRRFFALIIDLTAIGVITALTRSFALVLGVVAAAFFIRVSFQRTEVRGSVFGRAMRLSLGCLGVLIGVVTAVVWGSLGFFQTGGELPADLDVPGVEVEAPGGVAGLSALLSGLADLRELRDAESAEDAEVAATELATTLLDNGMSRVEAEEILLEAVPEETGWRGDAPEIVRRAIAAAAEDAEASAPADDAEGAPTGEVASLSTSEALQRYAGLLDSPPAESEQATFLAIRARLQEEIAGDTLGALAEEVARLERTAAARQEDISDLRVALREEREGGGVFRALRNFVDELGFGFGWASLYMTVLLSWWKGQTLGKKLMGIRVLRLDGEPITWWVAFERAGGYAAGFATGLLGFAQVWWDANRQAIHDRIVGTVVVVDGAEPVENWEQVM